MATSTDADEKQQTAKERLGKNWLTFDRGLALGGLLCQIVLAITALIVYFFTVVPIQQKELMAEDLAKKQRDINNISELLSEIQERNVLEVQRHSELQSKNEKLSDENSSISASNEELKSSNEKLVAKNLDMIQKNTVIQQENEGLRNQSVQIQLEIQQKTTRLAQLNKTLYSNYARIFQEEMAECSRNVLRIENYNAHINDFNNNQGRREGNGIDWIDYQSTHSLPIDCIKSCLNDYARSERFSPVMSLVSLPLKKELASTWRKKLENKPDLRKSSFDKSVVEEIVKEMNDELAKFTFDVNSPRYRIDVMNVARPFLDKINSYQREALFKDMHRVTEFFGVTWK